MTIEDYPTRGRHESRDDQVIAIERVRVHIRARAGWDIWKTPLKIEDTMRVDRKMLSRSSRYAKYAMTSVEMVTLRPGRP